MVDPRLYIQAIGFLAGGAFAIGLAFFVLFKDYKRPLNFLFFLMNISISTFLISHALGISVKDPYLSRNIFMFNISCIPIAVFTCHWILVLTKKTEKFKSFIVVMYVAAIAFSIFYIVFPESFLLPSVPKLYMPNYYSPGWFDWVGRIIFNIFLPIFLIYQIFKSYLECKDPIEKNRLRYSGIGTFYGYFFCTLALPLAYDIPVDPLWAMFACFYPAFLAYAIVKYELMDIRVAAKRAAIYTFFVVGLIVFVSFINSSTEAIQKSYSAFPGYIIPIFSSLFIVAIGWTVWSRIKEADLLKYEFINVITHKFRTPLTEIKWCADGIESDDYAARKKKGLQIKKATSLLVELTNALTVLNNSDNSSTDYSYKPQLLRLDILVKNFLAPYQNLAYNKGVKMSINTEGDGVYILADKIKIKFLVEVLADNAVKYTPSGGEIKVNVKREGRKAVLKISDTGIGISKKERPFVFSRFYRAQNATTAHTEGLGIGLHLASIIVKRHGGNIYLNSAGENMGTTFTVILPLARKNTL